MDIELLKKIGFSDKSAPVYLALLTLGPSPVRKLAEYTGFNRGTTYDILKWLQDEGLVNFYNKDTKQYFVAEDPEKLHQIVRARKEELSNVDTKLDRMIPELQALYNSGGERPVARYYSAEEIPQILQDVLDTCEAQDESLYRIYSTEGIREYLYQGFETFSDARVSKNIGVRVIAIGEGGELRGLDERKWLKASSVTPTYIIVYPGKTAYISLNAKKEPIGVVIENPGVYETQKLVFDTLWSTLS